MIAKWPRVAALLVLVPVLAAGCRLLSSSDAAKGPSAAEPPEPTPVDYVDTDAFDRVFEAELVAGAPAILVRTEHEKPDWGPRLNAWIAAWNRGGRSRGR